MKLRRTDDRNVVAALHALCLPGDDLDIDDGQMWVAHDDTGTPVAFCSARPCGDNLVFLSRAGVLPCANGKGLQRRMIQARLRWAREIGADACITYTLYDNHASIANLLRCGFRFYRPAANWAGRVHYFWRDI